MLGIIFSFLFTSSAEDSKNCPVYNTNPPLFSKGPQEKTSRNTILNRSTVLHCKNLCASLARTLTLR